MKPLPRNVLALPLLGALLACSGANAPLHEASPSGFQRVGWRQTLVHPSLDVFHAEEFRIDAGNREEFDNLVRVVTEAFRRMPEFDRRGPTFHDLLRETAWRMRDPRRPARAILLFHTRDLPGGRTEAEGMTLTLATLLEIGRTGDFYETLTLRMEDEVVDGWVDGEIDFVQLVLDTNTTGLGAMEVVLDRGPERRPAGWRVRVSRVYDSGPLMREGTGTHQATDLGRIAEDLETMIYRPLAGSVSTGDSEVWEVNVNPRLPGEVPRRTSFPPEG